MAYDISRDQTVKEMSLGVGQNSTIRVGLYKYGDGETKVGMNRVGLRRDGTPSYGAIGRMTLVELRIVVPALIEMGKELKNLPVQNVAAPKPAAEPAVEDVGF